MPKSSWQSPGIGRFGTVANGAVTSGGIRNGNGSINGVAAVENGGQLAYELESDEMEDPPQHTLAWNADGTRLAYAVLHQVSLLHVDYRSLSLSSLCSRPIPLFRSVPYQLSSLLFPPCPVVTTFSSHDGLFSLPPAQQNAKTSLSQQNNHKLTEMT